MTSLEFLPDIRRALVFCGVEKDDAEKVGLRQRVQECLGTEFIC